MAAGPGVRARSDVGTRRHRTRPRDNGVAGTAGGRANGNGVADTVTRTGATTAALPVTVALTQTNDCLTPAAAFLVGGGKCPTAGAFGFACGPAPLVDHGTTVPGR